MSNANIQIVPMDVYFGKNTPQVETIKTTVGTLLGGKYFLFTTSAGVKHYAWFNTGLSVDPAPAGGWAANPVSILVGDSASEVATKLAAVLTVIAGFDATASGNTVTLTHTATGYAEPAYDSVAAPTLFAFKVTTLGMTEVNSGCIQGDIELSGFEQSKIPITCHASGTTVLEERISGVSNLNLAFTLQETDKDSLKRLLSYYGMNSFTPVGADKESVFGVGTPVLGSTNPRIYIRMHPVALDASDKSKDYNFWTSELSLESFNFSGENVSAVPATFVVYPDKTKPKSIQFFMIGDAVKAGY